MGVHVSLYYADGREWSDWDCYRHSRDDEFAIGANKPSERWILSIAKDGTRCSGVCQPSGSIASVSVSGTCRPHS